METILRYALIGGFTLATGLLFPGPASAGDEAPYIRGVSRTIACAFYADGDPFIDTGVGQADARAAAVAYECRVHQEGDGGSGGGEEPTEPEPTDPPAEAE